MRTIRAKNPSVLVGVLVPEALTVGATLITTEVSG